MKPPAPPPKSQAHRSPATHSILDPTIPAPSQTRTCPKLASPDSPRPQNSLPHPPPEPTPEPAAESKETPPLPGSPTQTPASELQENRQACPLRGSQKTAFDPHPPTAAVPAATIANPNPTPRFPD